MRSISEIVDRLGDTYHTKRRDRAELDSKENFPHPPTPKTKGVLWGVRYLTIIVLAVDGNHRRPIRVGTSEKGCEHEGVRITATSSRRALAKSRAR